MVYTRRSKVDAADPTSQTLATDPSLRSVLYSLSEAETQEIGAQLAQTLKGGELILLEGDLGMGKTVLARGIAEGLGVPEDDVSSPSFTLVQEYSGSRFPLFHIDLYRLEEGDDLESLGLDEIVQAGGVVLIEWGEKLPGYYQRRATRIQLHDIGEGSRRIDLQPAQKRAGRPREDS